MSENHILAVVCGRFPENEGGEFEGKAADSLEDLSLTATRFCCMVGYFWLDLLNACEYD